MKITEKQIKDYHAQAEGYLKREIEKDYPEVFKVDLWDKWLVDDSYPEWMSFYKKEQNYVTGLDSSGVWFEQVRVSDPNKNERNKPATQEQILAMLSKEAVKRGYKDGNHMCLLGLTFVNSIKGFHYEEDSNGLYFNENLIFQNGAWADIIQEPVYEWRYVVYMPLSKEYEISKGFYTRKKELKIPFYEAIRKIKETKRLRK